MFNWIYWSMGIVVRIIVVVVMFLGMDLLGLNFFDLWKIYVMIGFVVWYVGIEIVLEVYVYWFFCKVEILDDDRIQIFQLFIVVEIEGYVFKKVVLVIYVCGNVIFFIVFLFVINYL